MKKFTVSLFIMLVTLAIQAQDYLIHFAGNGATLETVYVENLTKGTYITINGNDVLHLVTGVGINQIENEKFDLKVYPNPMDNTCNIEFFNSVKGNVDINIYDIAGKAIFNYKNLIEKGIHRYNFSGISKGTYLINIKTQENNYTSRIISLSNTASNFSYEYLGKIDYTQNLQEVKTKETKEPKGTIIMYFNNGDQLRFMGYAGGYAQTLYASPNSNNTYTFNFNFPPSGTPIVRFDSVYDITTNSLKTSSVVLYENGNAVSERGIVYAITPNVTVNNTKITNGISSGVFNTNITGLTPNTKYYINAYGFNTSGHGYGQEKTATTLAEATTTTASNNTLTSFTAGGTVGVGGSATITERGIVYGTAPNPTKNNNFVIASSATTGDFTVDITGLTENTTYYYRAYVVNAGGINYGSQGETKTLLTTMNLLDERDGTVYKTVTIGNQVWMAENLKYLPSVVGPGTGSKTTPYYYVYGYNGTVVADAKATSNYTTYGVLYNWPAAMNGATSSTANPSGVQGACPTGWHLPSDAEWTELTDYLGGTSEAGGKLKETDTTHWTNPNTGATNETGFTALPGGDRKNDGKFYYVGYDGYWWSTTENDNLFVLPRRMHYYLSDVFRSDYYKESGLSVRCVKD